MRHRAAADAAQRAVVQDEGGRRAACGAEATRERDSNHARREQRAPPASVARMVGMLTARARAMKAKHGAALRRERTLAVSSHMEADKEALEEKLTELQATSGPVVQKAYGNGAKEPGGTDEDVDGEYEL